MECDVVWQRVGGVDVGSHKGLPALSSCPTEFPLHPTLMETYCFSLLMLVRITRHSLAFHSVWWHSVYTCSCAHEWSLVLALHVAPAGEFSLALSWECSVCVGQLFPEHTGSPEEPRLPPPLLSRPFWSLGNAQLPPGQGASTSQGVPESSLPCQLPGGLPSP